jgi:hypothetical protein
MSTNPLQQSLTASQQLGNAPKKPEELEVLQEDDEFEEFEDGMCLKSPSKSLIFVGLDAI